MTDATPRKSGWFGNLMSFSTVKKAPRAESGSESTESAARNDTHRGSGRRMEITLTSPSERNMARTAETSAFNGGASAVDLLDTGASSPVARANGFSSAAAAQMPAKSPWKYPNSNSNLNSNPNSQSQLFSHGNLKPAPQQNGQRPPLRRRRRYRGSKLLLSAKRRNGVPFDADTALNVLQQSKSLFQPSKREVERQQNYSMRIRRGRHIYGSGGVGGSRLAPAEPIAGIKQEREQSASEPVEQRAPKRAKVTFGDGVAEAAPVAVDVQTPKRSQTSQRKATPFKPSSERMDMDTRTPSSASSQHSATSVASPPWGFPATFLMEDGQTTFLQAGEEDLLGPPQITGSELFESSFAFVPDTTTNTAKREYFDPKKEIVSKKNGGTSADPTPGDDNAKALPTTGWGDVFKAQRSQWKCDVCSSRNEEDSKKCVSCEAPRPGYENEVAKSEAKPAATGSIGAGGFTFSAPSASVTSSSTGGFQFGAPTSQSESAAPSAPTGTTGFIFGASTGSSTTDKPAAAGGFTLGTSTAGSSTSTSSSSTKETMKPFGYTFASTPAPAPATGVPFKFPVPADEKKTEETTKPAISFGTSTPAHKPAVPQDAKTEPAMKRGRPLGSPASVVPSSTSKAGSTSTTFPGLNFGAGSSSTPSLSRPADESGKGGDEDRRKKRRGRDEDSSASAPTAPTFGGSARVPTASTPVFPTFGQKTDPNPATAGLSFAGSTSGSYNFGAKAADGSGSAPAAPTFGATPAAAPAASTSEPKPAPAVPTFGATPAPASAAPTFGSTPAPAPAAPTFGSTPAPAPAAPTFGATPAPAAPTFGSTPAPSVPTFGATPAPAVPTFGSATAPAPAVPTFGATPAPAAPTFGSTPATAAPTFGATPAPAAPTFGSTPAPAAPAFGSTPAPAAPTFGATPAPAPAAPTFGATPAPAAPTFGSTPAPAFGSTPAQPSGATPAASNFGAAPLPAFGGTPAQAAPGFGSTPAAPFGAAPAPFGAAPAPFGATATTPGFNGNFGGAAPAPPPASFGAPPANGAPVPGGFGAPAAGGFGTAAGAPPAGGAPQFSLGTSGTRSNTGGRIPGRRRIKARRPQR